MCVNWHIQVYLLCYIWFTSKSFLNYSNLVWGQNANAIKCLTIPQKKTLRLMNFKYKNFYTFPLYLSLNILRLLDKSFLENCLLISTAIKNILSSLFDDSFTFVSEIHHHETSFSTKGLSKIPIMIPKVMANTQWRSKQKHKKDISLSTLTPSQLKFFLTKQLTNNY